MDLRSKPFVDFTVIPSLLLRLELVSANLSSNRLISVHDDKGDAISGLCLDVFNEQLFHFSSCNTQIRNGGNVYGWVTGVHTYTAK